MKKNRLRTRRTSVHGWFLCAAAGAVVLSAAPAAHADEPSLTPRFEKSQHFTIDPVVDGVLIATSYGFSVLLDMILSTGEIRPSLPGSTDKLLAIDRVAVTQSIDPHAGTYSNIGIWVAYGYVLLDLAHSGLRDGRNALLVDAIMYAESLSLTSMLTSMTKIAVRRPRPIDYVNCGSTETAPGGACTTDTNLQLSFFSGHASAAGAMSATATYLAFVRSGAHSARPWITLVVGTALTAFISYERVRSGEHFPTDVIVGATAGAAIGVLVPHFHRRPHLHEKRLEIAPQWIGFAPPSHGATAVSMGWVF
jgi:membrane-associated phospholipid phosphatase